MANQKTPTLTIVKLQRIMTRFYYRYQISTWRDSISIYSTSHGQECLFKVLVVSVKNVRGFFLKLNEVNCKY